MGFFSLLVLAGIGFYLYKKAKTPVPGLDGGYSKEELSSGGYKFKSSPNTIQKVYLSAGGAASILIYGILWFFLFAICAAILAARYGMALPLLLSVALAIPPGNFVTSKIKGAVQKAVSKRILSQNREFNADQNGLWLDGKAFPSVSIARLIVRNMIDETEVSSSGASVVPVVNAATVSGAAAGILATANSVGADHQRHYVRQIAYAVFFESGGNRHLLGSGLSEPQSFGLMTEVANILGFKA